MLTAENAEPKDSDEVEELVNAWLQKYYPQLMHKQPAEDLINSVHSLIAKYT